MASKSKFDLNPNLLEWKTHPQILLEKLMWTTGPLLIQSVTVLYSNFYSIFIETPDSRFRQTANVNLYHVTKFSPLLLFTVH